LSHDVRTHTRKVGGKTVTVRKHSASDPAAEQRKRDAFERRVVKERQEAAHPEAYPARRTPGLRTKRKKRTPGRARAKRHAKKALRLWRRHKVKAVLFAGLALGELGAWAAVTGAGKARKAFRKLRQRRKKAKR
jgi:hypothetical protein